MKAAIIIVGVKKETFSLSMLLREILQMLIVTGRKFAQKTTKFWSNSSASGSSNKLTRVTDISNNSNNSNSNNNINNDNNTKPRPVWNKHFFRVLCNSAQNFITEFLLKRNDVDDVVDDDVDDDGEEAINPWVQGCFYELRCRALFTFSFVSKFIQNFLIFFHCLVS